MPSSRVVAVTAREPEAAAAVPERIAVRKTYKIYIGGQFPRSESGRSYVVSRPDGVPLANAVRGSRKDVRDAVKSARGAFNGWADRTAMNRGQVLYRAAEVMEGRRDSSSRRSPRRRAWRRRRRVSR